MRELEKYKHIQTLPKHYAQRFAKNNNSMILMQKTNKRLHRLSQAWKFKILKYAYLQVPEEIGGSHAYQFHGHSYDISWYMKALEYFIKNQRYGSWTTRIKLDARSQGHRNYIGQPKILELHNKKHWRVKPINKYKVNSLSGEEVCLDACRHGSCDPLVKIIFDPAI